MPFDDESIDVGNGDTELRLNKLERWAVGHNAKANERYARVSDALERFEKTNDEAHMRISRTLEKLADSLQGVKGSVIRAGAVVAAILIAIELYDKILK